MVLERRLIVRSVLTSKSLEHSGWSQKGELINRLQLQRPLRICLSLTNTSASSALIETSSLDFSSSRFQWMPIPWEGESEIIFKAPTVQV